MNGIERGQLLGALMTLVVLMFVAAGTPHAQRWRRQLRAAAIGTFIIAIVAVLVEISLWLWSG